MRRFYLFDPNMSPDVILLQELRQAKVRVIFGFLIILIFCLLAIYLPKYSNNSIYWVLIPGSLGIIWGSIQIFLFKFKKNLKPSVFRILLSQSSDSAIIAIGVAASGDLGSLFFVVFLWIILGNGMRFGLRLMITCQMMSLSYFSAGIYFFEYWQTHIELAASYIAILILIPGYFGSLVRLLGNIRDELLKKEKTQVDLLKKMDDLKTTFFANISHEFRTPIALTLGSMDLMEKNSSEAVKQIPIIRRNQNRLLQLINQILDLEKMEKGKLELKFCPLLNLDSFIKHRAEQFQSMAAKKGLKLSIVLNSGLPEQAVFADPDNLDKVIFNLLSNAFKFTNTGTVTITTLKTTRGAEISVQDTGQGIREDQLQFIFDRFRQATGSESKDYAGTGIGLSLVQEIIKLHGGEIEVTSTYGQGTKFTVVLPLGKNHLEANQINFTPFSDDGDGKPQFDLVREGLSDVKGIEAHATRNEEVLKKLSKSKKTILYVDDNYDLREFLISLIGESYNLILAWDGLAALDILKSIVPDLILSDLMMPKLDGLGLLKKVRENPDLRETPFVILTAKATDNAKMDLLEAGADDFLFKPFTRDELLVRIRNLLSLREETMVNRKQLLEAKKIQRSLLPPVRVDLERTEVTVLYNPCDTLSGDFFDIIVKDDILLVYLADVTSHGTSAAQITYLVKSTMKGLFEERPGDRVSDLLTQFANRYIKYDLDYGVGIQVFKYDLKNRTLSYTASNAPSAYLQSQDEMSALNLGSSSIIDAKFAEKDPLSFPEATRQMNENDIIFFFTDGCFEFNDQNGREFGERALIREFKKISGQDKWDESLFHRLCEIQGKNRFADDMTAIRLCFKSA